MRPDSPSAILRYGDVPAFLVSNLVNIRFLTGLSMTAGLLLVKRGRYVLFVDGRYSEMATKGAPADVAVKDLDTMEKMMEKIDVCGIEADDVTLARKARWKRHFKNTKFVQKKAVIEEFRRQKSTRELALFRRAQRITQEMLLRVPSVLRSGVTEQKIAWQLESWAREMGAEGLSFDPIVAFGTHSARPHHRATDRKLKKGNIVQVDVGARYKGFCADQSEVFFTKKPNDLQKRVYEAVKESQEAAIKAVHAGALNRAIDTVARDVLEEHGFEEYFTHGLGHGVGLEVHEGPLLSSGAKKTELLRNEIVTIEPGVYIPGKFGMRLEREVIVRKRNRNM